MPKKGKKGGKSKGKKGKGGKGGKKGKKGNKEDKKTREENIAKLAITNSNIWEARLEMLEQSKAEYRETANRLANQNSEMHDVLVKSEKDTIDVITYMKNQQSLKENEISQLTENILELKLLHKKEKQAIITDMSEQIIKLENDIKEKNNDILLLKNELKMVNEFRKKRTQLNAEFQELKDALHESNKSHQDAIGKMEKKFLEEKMRLQLEASKKISELAEAAHKEAIDNLDEATRSIFKENVRANEALKYHIQNTEKQREKVHFLKGSNQHLKVDKEILNKTVSEKVAENGKLKEKVKELSSKVELLEKALTQTVKEFDTSNQQLRLLHENEIDSSTKEIEKLKRLLDLRTSELKKIRALAKQVLSDRSDIEKFFLESLEMVKKEIAANQNQYKKDAQIAYQQKMMMAYNGKSEYPPVKTFGKSDTSSNSVYHDLKAAMKFYNNSGMIDIGDLTWEQRERVIRYLFTKMNTSQTQKNNSGIKPTSQSLVVIEELSLPPLPGKLESPPREQEQLDIDDLFNDGGITFVTQGVDFMEK